MLGRVLRRLVLAVTIVAGIACGAPSVEAADASPTAFIQTLADQALGILQNKSISEDQRKAAFSTLFTQNFDAPTIGRFVLGQYWRTATPAQQSEYLQLFGQYVVTVYADRFSAYTGGVTFKATTAQPNGANTWSVASIINRGAGAPPVDVDWVVTDKSGQYKIIDVVVENLSMRLTQRDEFASVIARGGGNVETLIDLLKQKVQGG